MSSHASRLVSSRESPLAPPLCSRERRASCREGAKLKSAKRTRSAASREADSRKLAWARPRVANVPFLEAPLLSLCNSFCSLLLCVQCKLA